MTLERTAVIEIFDFRQGIIDPGEVWTITQERSSGFKASAGAATPNTYNVYADPLTGSLIPLPAVQQATFVVADADADLLTANDANSSPYKTTWILDAILVQANYRPEVATGWTSSKADQTLGMLFVVEGASYYATTTSRKLVNRGRWYNLFDNTSDIDFAFQAATEDVAFPTGLGLASLTFGRTSVTTSSCTVGDLQPTLAFNVNVLPFTANTGTISSPWGANQTTYTTDIATTYGPTMGLFPNPATPTVPSVTASALNGKQTQNGFLMIHQGRLVYVSNAIKKNFASTNSYVLSDAIHFTDSLQWQVAGGDLVINDSISGFGVGTTFNANSLLLIKNEGGAVSIRGSLNNPQVVNLPAVESTHGYQIRGCMTPMGYFYINTNGAWVYQDNTEASKLVSVQLTNQHPFDPDWSYAQSLDPAQQYSYFPKVGALGYMAPWVWVWNNYIFDIRTQSWWRWRLNNLHDPTDVTDAPLTDASVEAYKSMFTGAFFLPNGMDVNGYSPTQMMYILPRQRSNDGNIHYFAYANYDKIASEWQWTSHVLLPTRTDALYTPTEIEIHTSLNQYWWSDDITFTITVNGTDENGVPLSEVLTITLDINSVDANYAIGTPMVLKASFAAEKRFANMSLVIKAEDADDLYGNAPNLNGIKLYYQEHSNLPYTSYDTVAVRDVSGSADLRINVTLEAEGEVS